MYIYQINTDEAESSDELAKKHVLVKEDLASK